MKKLNELIQLFSKELDQSVFYGKAEKLVLKGFRSFLRMIPYSEI